MIRYRTNTFTIKVLANFYLDKEKTREKLIYDRKSSDITNKTKKGYYNYNDLNRVESWCEFLKNELNNMGYTISFTTKKNWTRNDFPTDAELERVRKNIQALMTGFRYITKIYVASNIMNYDRANRYEKILFEIYSMLQGTQGYYVYSGVANAGQSRVWQTRFRRHVTMAFTNDEFWRDFEDAFEWQDFDANYTWNDFI